MYNRVRTRGSYPVYSSTTAVFTRKNMSAIVTPISNYVVAGNSVTTSDVWMAGFKKAKALGKIFNNSFSSVKSDYSYVDGTRNLTYTKPGGTPANGQVIASTRGANNGVPYLSSVPAVDVSSLRSAAAIAALNNVEKPSVEGIPFLVEIRQTMEMLRNPISGFTKLVDRQIRTLESSRRRNVKIYSKAIRLLNDPKWARGASNSAKRSVRLRSLDRALTATRKYPSAESYAVALANQHLSFMFGVKPFVSDMRALLEIVSSAIRDERKPERKTARGKSSLYVEPLLADGTYNDGEVYANLKFSSKREVSCRAGILYTVDIDLGLSKMGLTLSDIPAALWEVTPWSFVIDWVSNIGDVISALSPKIGVNILSQWIVVQSLTTNVVTLGSLHAINTDFTASGGGDQRTLVINEKTRDPVNLAVLVQAELNIKLNLSRALLSLSLLTQKMKQLHSLTR